MRVRRFGGFLILIGLGLGGLFYLSIQSKKMETSLLIGGLVCIAIGLIIRQIVHSTTVDSGRFRIFRRKYDNNNYEEDE